MKKYFIGVDESYDMKIKGNFVLCLFFIKNEKDYTFLASSIEKILIDEDINEMKNNKSSDSLKEKYFRKLKHIDYEYYIYVESINTHKDINLYYKNGIERFIKNINIKFDVSEKIYLDIKLDKFGGEKINNYFVSILNSGFKKFIHHSKYQNSRSSILIQYADLFAGENSRLLFGNKIKNKSALNKNKILL